MKKLSLALIALGLATPLLAQQSALPSPMKGGMHKGMRGKMMDMGPVTRAQAQERAKARFAHLDTNRDGFVTKEELIAGRPARGMARPDHDGDGEHDGPKGGGRFADMQFERMDANKDGKVSEAEFIAFHLARFDATDANHDGTVTAEERKTAMEAMREKVRGGWDIKTNTK